MYKFISFLYSFIGKTLVISADMRATLAVYQFQVELSSKVLCTKCYKFDGKEKELMMCSFLFYNLKLRFLHPIRFQSQQPSDLRYSLFFLYFPEKTKLPLFQTKNKTS